MPGVKNIIGETFGKLTVTGICTTRTRKNKRLWNCLCTCGNTTYASGGNLTSGNTKSCGCFRKENPCLPIGAASFNALLRRNKTSAKNTGRTWELADEDFRQLTSKPCHYCGRKPIPTKPQISSNGAYNYNGLDRIDNAKGYTLSNVVSCCKHCNIAKRNRTVDDFYSWAANLYHTFVEPKPLVSKTHFPAEILA
jgi:hypothetical protein